MWFEAGERYCEAAEGSSWESWSALTSSGVATLALGRAMRRIRRRIHRWRRAHRRVLSPARTLQQRRRPIRALYCAERQLHTGRSFLILCQGHHYQLDRCAQQSSCPWWCSAQSRRSWGRAWLIVRRMNILTGALGSSSNTLMLTSVLATGQAIDPCTLWPIPLASSRPTLRTE